MARYIICKALGRFLTQYKVSIQFKYHVFNREGIVLYSYINRVVSKKLNFEHMFSYYDEYKPKYPYRLVACNV